MVRYYALRADGRIGMTSDAPMPGAVEHDFPEGFDFERQQDWKVVDGALVYEPMVEDDTPPYDPILQRLDEQEAAICELAALIAGEGGDS